MKRNRFFEEVNGNFGFGCMRLPMNGDEVDLEKFAQMVDAFLDAGFNYFDTAHAYISGKSETAIRECISKRYDRSRFVLADKLTDPFFDSEEDIRPFFLKQLEWCGVEYFDFYLMHAQGLRNYDKFKRCRAYETAYELKLEGLIRHLGLSFHDRAEVLDMILTEHPEIEIVELSGLDQQSVGLLGYSCHALVAEESRYILYLQIVDASVVGIHVGNDDIHQFRRNAISVIDASLEDHRSRIDIVDRFRFRFSVQ